MSIYENSYELIYMSRMGDEYAQTALFLQYEGLLNALVNQTLMAYPSVRCYRDDLLQEARISLFQAINQYQESKNTTFKTFVCLVVKRRIWNVVRDILVDHQHKGFDAISLDDQDTNYYEILEQSNRLAEPEYYVQYQTAANRLQEEIGLLDAEERNILSCWLASDSYQDASDKLGLSKKQYDGRLQRVKKKIKRALYE
ncbi:MULTISPECIES: sigma-70 family RNA polymerase sigma factor [Terrabacteria group]|uniref:sigma-70 family RNA polymerase sigma factor n=1 Tax=Bacillati TaxID=1783272 RepID=UPI0019395269|nr:MULTISPECIES: sigma-70 family RNA polymerase sigma factor [Terrabacteria group]MBW9212448.1 sigma-70 family RNA polymerase sigma factor [Trueperella sp. zg.1013]QRG86795.1 sigma-70 family RNA polymerase sigma factor [Bulleidia sp. zg-1006]